jgi:hypothetical protein
MSKNYVIYIYFTVKWFEHFKWGTEITVYVSLATHMHAQRCTRTRTHRHMHTNANTYTCMHTHANTCMQTHTHTHTHTHKQAHKQTCTQTHMHVHTHTYIITYILFIHRSLQFCTRFTHHMYNSRTHIIIWGSKLLQFSLDTHMRMPIHTCTYTFLSHTCTCMHTNTLMHAHTRTCMYATSIIEIGIFQI